MNGQTTRDFIEAESKEAAEDKANLLNGRLYSEAREVKEFPTMPQQIGSYNSKGKRNRINTNEYNPEWRH